MGFGCSPRGPLPRQRSRVPDVGCSSLSLALGVRVWIAVRDTEEGEFPCEPARPQELAVPLPRACGVTSPCMRMMGAAVHRSEVREGGCFCCGVHPPKGRRVAASLELLSASGAASLTRDKDAAASLSLCRRPQRAGGTLPARSLTAPGHSWALTGEAEGLCVQRRPAPHFHGLCPLTVDRLPCSLLQVGSC